MAVIIRSMRETTPGYVVASMTRAGDVLAVNTGGTLNAAAVVIDENVGRLSGDLVEFAMSFAEVPGPRDWFRTDLRDGLENRVIRWMRFKMPEESNPRIRFGDLPRIMVQAMVLDRGIEIVASDAPGTVEALTVEPLTVNIRNQQAAPFYFDQDLFFSGLHDLIHLSATSSDTTGLEAAFVRRYPRDTGREFGQLFGPPYRLACRGKRTGTYSIRMLATDAAGRQTVNTVQANV